MASPSSNSFDGDDSEESLRQPDAFKEEVETSDDFGGVCITVTHEVADEDAGVSWNGARIRSVIAR